MYYTDWYPLVIAAQINQKVQAHILKQGEAAAELSGFEISFKPQHDYHIEELRCQLQSETTSTSGLSTL